MNFCKKTFFKSVMLSITLLLSVTACVGNKEDDQPIPKYYQAFATLTDINGNYCTFAVQSSPDAAPTYFYSTLSQTKDLQKGSRYVLTYTKSDGGEFTPGNITIYAIYGTFDGKVTEAPLSEIKEFTDYVNIIYYGRTGNYLNLQALSELVSLPTTFALYVDEATINDEYPEVYICFKKENGWAQKDATLFASFDISYLMALNTAKGFKLNCIYQGVKKSITIETGRQGLQPAN